MKILKNTIWFSLLAILLTACPEKDNGPSEAQLRADSIAAHRLLVNEWINAVMNEVYYWEDRIPASLEPDTATTPEEFFDRHIYKAEDSWSWIDDDAESLLKEFDGVPVSMGYSPEFFQLGSSNVAILVVFVIPNSPADRAGIKRGDIIYKINGKHLTFDNYYSEYSKSSYTATIGFIKDGMVNDAGKSVNLVAEQITADPTLHNEIIDLGDIKIGYLVYTDFTSGIGDAFLTTLGNALQSFKTNNVDEIVIDLRYNPGGEVTAAQFLASALVPQQYANSETQLIKLDFNAYVESYFLATDPSRLYHNYMQSDYNLNLEKVYFLTGHGSASASELLIIGLEPYMEVVTVGEYTRGKYTGSWVLYDFDSVPQHNYVMLPIVMKYQNSEGFTDFVNGLIPDHVQYDSALFQGKPFGDTTDIVLAKAIEVIRGKTPSIQQKASHITPQFKHLIPEELEWKYNVYFPTPMK